MLGEEKMESGVMTPKKLSQAEQQFFYVDREIGRLDGLIEKLTSKLSPVLTVIPPQTSEQEKECEILTPLAGEIRHIGLTLKGFSDRIDSILDRLEV